MSIGDKVRVAIETECSAIKAGNVHPAAAFHDLHHRDFLTAAKAIGEAVDFVTGPSVGGLALRATQSMMDAVGTNTSLGTILLLAPLIVAHSTLGIPNQQSIGQTLANMTPEDAQGIYRAIQIAKPGGLGESASMDVRGESPTCILDAMRVAADWDDVALQYVTKFDLVFSIAQRLKEKTESQLSMLNSIRCLQIELLAERADSLIARKQGREFANEIRQQANEGT